MSRDPTARALDLRLAEEQSRSRLPSLVAGIVRHGKMAWFGCAGEVEGSAATENTQYRCGSISKTFVAVEVIRLRDEGLVDLTAPIATYVPELEHLRCNVAHLLSHTSGIRAETAGPWWERTPGVPFSELVDSSIREVDLLDRPGRRFHYSNVGYAVLGELVRRVRGEAWDDVVDAELLRPLGMVRTTTRPVRPAAPGLGVHPHADVVLAEPEHDALSMAPAGQLWTTVSDLCRWSAVLAGARPEILSPETAAEMREPIAISDLPDLPWTTAHGLGLQVFNRDGRRSYGHGGSMPGFLAMLRIDAETGDVVIVMTNATSGLPPTLDSELLALYQEREPLPAEPWRPVPGGADPRIVEITGAWYWGTSTFVLSLSGDGNLSLRALALGREAGFRPTGEDTFIGLSGYYTGETLRVLRDAGGTAGALDIGSFILTRTPYDPTAPVPGGVDEAGWVGSAPEPERTLGLPHLRRRE
jgi:CubicO group peptidase (beta-lactamase class C family)